MLARGTESDAALREPADKYGDTMAYQIAEVHAFRGEADEAFAWLERAYRQRDARLACCLKTDPLLKRIRNDPRYAALLRRMKLPEHWKSACRWSIPSLTTAPNSIICRLFLVSPADCLRPPGPLPG